MRQLDKNSPETRWETLDASFVKERILIVTDRHLIDGFAFHPQGVRLSDTLNSPVHAQRPYLALADATVSYMETGKTLFSTSFLLVKRSEIVTISPVDEICPVSESDPLAEELSRDETL